MVSSGWAGVWVKPEVRLTAAKPADSRRAVACARVYQRVAGAYGEAMAALRR